MTPPMVTCAWAADANAPSTASASNDFFIQYSPRKVMQKDFNKSIYKMKIDCSNVASKLFIGNWVVPHWGCTQYTVMRCGLSQCG
jgi:hypothetical protein